MRIGDETGLDANALVNSGRLVAKVDSASVQDEAPTTSIRLLCNVLTLRSANCDLDSHSATGPLRLITGISRWYRPGSLIDVVGTGTATLLRRVAVMIKCAAIGR
jgi:hypothetical protein